MATTRHNYTLEARYADGYVHSELDHKDISPYLPGTANILNDILEKRPETTHGPLVRLTLLTPTGRHHIDWTKLPDNARPVRFIRFERDFRNGVWVGDARVIKVDFGYQYNDANGKSVKQIEEIN